MGQNFLAPDVEILLAKGRDRGTGAAGGRATRLPLPVFWLPLLAVLIAAGCNPKAKVAAEISPVGTYVLESVDGNRVPCTVQHGGAALTVKAGIFTVHADGTCSSKVVFSSASGRVASREVRATYTPQGPTLTMRWEGAGTTTGTLEGDTFTTSNEGMTFAYRR